jgi:predicted aminopeptidase
MARLAAARSTQSAQRCVALANGLVMVLCLSACQMPYLIKSAYSQAELLRHRQPLEEALNDSSISEADKAKLKLANDAREFAEHRLGLKHTSNYQSFVQLDRPYVTYVLSAAPRDELKHYLWSYPLVGELPYRGYFDPEDARSEETAMKARGYDTVIRGVTAYSTLGWFRDPILSSMLRSEDYELVNTIIHETVHATIYIRSEADFNERLAMFIGNMGTEHFFIEREGPNSATLAKIRNEREDEKQFGVFVANEAKALEGWYAAHKGSALNETERQARLAEIQARFRNELQPKFRTPGMYASFASLPLNNARLLNYTLYFQDLAEFERAFVRLGSDLPKFLSFAKSLEKSDHPLEALHSAAQGV